jgi:hypothetical protein
MFIPGRVISYFLLSILLLGTAVTASAQNDQRIEASYDVVLQIVIGGDDKTAGQPMPSGLSNITKQLRSSYSFADYRLTNTYVGRIANGGNFEFKSVSTIFGRGVESETPSFLDWSLAGLRSGQSASGKNDLMLQAFRFGARVPVKTGSVREEGGKQFPIFNYEPIGLNSSRVTLSENTPTLIGSLSLPGVDSAMFVVVTFRPA